MNPTAMRIGYFEHWSQPEYRLVDFLRDELKLTVEKIDYSRPGYLDGFDAVIIEQNGFNDYIENDDAYFQQYVRKGGICWFMHQDYRRWAPYFIPPEAGYAMLVHRYVTTIAAGNRHYKCYMMPTVEPAGRRLFAEPERILPEDLIFWRVRGNSFGIARGEERNPPEIIAGTATACAIPEADGPWEILASYCDPGVRDGALILQSRYGRGLYFWNQILFPEMLDEDAGQVLNFWKKYVPNVLAHFRRFRAGAPPALPPAPTVRPVKPNYRMAIHLHSLEWYGGDSSLGTIQAMMRARNFDIASLAVKSAEPYHGNMDLDRYCDDRVLFLHGQEYHPFNWHDSHDDCGHNTYHLLAIGIDPDAYTPEFTRSLFSDAEIDDYLNRAIAYVHAHGGAVCATHPYCDYWHHYPIDGVDMEELRPLSGTDWERFYLNGGRAALMNSVDLFGAQRLLDNPAVNFLYTDVNPPDRAAVVRAVKAGHCIAAIHFAECDIALGDFLPGDEIPREVAPAGILRIAARTEEGRNLTEIRIYAAEKILCRQSCAAETVTFEFALTGTTPEGFIRVEIAGERGAFAASTPFYLI